MEELLKNISSKDLEKLKMLFSFIPGYEPKEVITLRVFVDEYSNWIKQNRSIAYHVSVMSSFKHLIDFFGQQKSIREIRLKETENFCSYLQQKVCRGYRVYYRTLKAAYNKAVEWGYVSENFFIKVKLPKKQKIAPAFISSEQLRVISDQVKNETIKDIIVFAFYTGMRLDEIVNLCWKNIDLGNRVITVGDENFTTKGRKQRFIPICEEALKAIENVKLRMQNGENKKIIPIQSLDKVHAYVFCKANGERYTGDHISQSFKRACKAAGVDKAIHFHTLRHSFASYLVQKGVPLYTIKELLGHSSISTTEIYSHLNMDSLRDAIKKLDGTPSCVLPPAKAEQALSKEEKSVLKVFRIDSINQQ